MFLKFVTYALLQLSCPHLFRWHSEIKLSNKLSARHDIVYINPVDVILRGNIQVAVLNNGGGAGDINAINQLNLHLY